VEVKMFNRAMHEVIGGYPNEKVMCTKKKYEKSDSKVDNTGE
jgi:hypothetical protein